MKSASLLEMDRLDNAKPDSNRRVSRWQTFVSPILVLSAGLILFVPFLTRFPLVADAEPVLADPAINFATNGQMADPLLIPLVPGAAHNMYEYPPLYFAALGAWLKLVGFGLVHVRLFSAVCGLVIVLFVYLIARFWTSEIVAAAVALLAAASPWVISSSRLGRMDALAVALILLGAWLYLNAERRGFRPSWTLFAGMAAGSAFISHPLGVISIVAGLIALVWWNHTRGSNRRVVLVFVLGVALPAAIWILYALQDGAAFLQVMALQISRKAHAPNYFDQFSLAKSYVALFGVLIILCLWFLIRMRKSSGQSYVAFLAVFAFAGATIGREVFYFVYFVPLFCIVAGLVWQAFPRQSVIAAGVSLAFLNELIGAGVHWQHQSMPEYAVSAAEIRSAIPPGRSVFIGPGAGEVYFALRNRNPMQAYSGTGDATGINYRELAMNSDYVAVSTPVPWFADLASAVSSAQIKAVINQGTPGAFSIYLMRP